MSPADRTILRELARRVRDIADSPEMPARRERWHTHNALKPQRPLVLCFPEGAWDELLPESACRCEDALLRRWEWDLRHRIYWWEHIHDDNALEPCFNIGWDIAIGDFGVSIPHTQGEKRGSYVWDHPVKDLDADLAKLRIRPLSVDRDSTLSKLHRAHELFGDIIPPRIRGKYWWTSGLTQDAIKLVGIEGLMLGMCDNPAGVHRLMAFLRDDHLNFITWLERENLLSPANTDFYTGSGGVGYTHELPGKDGTEYHPARLAHQWGFAESQETVGISPAMFDEFIAPYQRPILEHFGLNCYGCCEPVHTRLDTILGFPRIRRISVSPWCDEAIMAERLKGRAIFSRKPNPAMICMSWDEDHIRQDLRTTLAHAGRQPLEFIMKDTHTVQSQPWRIERWVRIALEEAQRSAGE